MNTDTRRIYADTRRIYAASLADYNAGNLHGLWVGVPDHLRNYIDYEAMGRDFEMGGDISAIDGTDGTYIFSNH